MNTDYKNEINQTDDLGKKTIHLWLTNLFIYPTIYSVISVYVLLYDDDNDM